MSESIGRFSILDELITFAEFQAKRKFLAQHPDASKDEIEEYLNKWYCDKGSPTLDSDTRLIPPIE